MCIPDVTHKFLPGYVGGVQEGARTPAGKEFTSSPQCQPSQACDFTAEETDLEAEHKQTKTPTRHKQ